MTTHDKQKATRHAKEQAPVKVRPTLVVGLGGTGCRALAWFNHLVREIFDGMPTFLKIMAVDSDVLEQVEQVTTPFPKSDLSILFEDAQLDDILRESHRSRTMASAPWPIGTLDLPSGDIQLDDIAWDLDVEAAHQAHVRWRQSRDRSSAETGRGCLGISRLGRAVYSAKSQQIISPAVLERFCALNRLDMREQPAQTEPIRLFELAHAPVVHVVSSLCGGTGSGMLLDMAKDIRDWSREVFERPAEIIAHLVLPQAFRNDSPEITDKLRAVACSMLEQIEFLMDHRRDSLAAEYPGKKRREFGKRDHPFDACYLLNGHGVSDGDTRDQVTEMIARMIHTMVLEPESQAIQCTLNNMRLDVLSMPDRTDRRGPCFSTYGLRDGTMSCTCSGQGLSSGRLESMPSLAEQWRFSFGFCLPALDNYAAYQAAQERFLALSNSKREDLWLDPNWLEAYADFLRDIGMDRDGAS